MRDSRDTCPVGDVSVKAQDEDDADVDHDANAFATPAGGHAAATPLPEALETPLPPPEKLAPRNSTHSVDSEFTCDEEDLAALRDLALY